jgi:hypothetical protein
MLKERNRKVNKKAQRLSFEGKENHKLNSNKKSTEPSDLPI